MPTMSERPDDRARRRRSTLSDSIRTAITHARTHRSDQIAIELTATDSERTSYEIGEQRENFARMRRAQAAAACRRQRT
jgi:hypothetical protein